MAWSDRSQQQLDDALISAADGEPEMARMLLDLGAKPDGMALIMAIQCGAREIVRWYIEASADVNQPFRDTTPVIRAVRSGYPEVVAVVLAAGADVNQFDAAGRSPLVASKVPRLAVEREPGARARIEDLLRQYRARDNGRAEQ